MLTYFILSLSLLSFTGKRDFPMNNKKTRRLSILTLALTSLLIAGCDGKPDTSAPATDTSAPSTDTADTSKEAPETIYTVADAMDLAALGGENSTSSYCVKGVIKSFTNYYYGQITLTDGTNDLSVYGTYMLDAEGKTVYFNEMDYIPVIGDTLTIYGVVKTYKGTPEMGKSVIKNIEKTHEEETINEEGYATMSIAESRNAAVGTKVKLTGVVALKTFTQKMNYNGFYLIDSTGSLFIYGVKSTYRLQEGNTVTVIGEIDHFIASNEISLAEKIGYQGSIQLTNTFIVKNEGGKSEFDKSWVKESTIKEILDTDVKEKNITTDVFHVKSILRSKNVDGILNFYFNDLDGQTGSYVYSSNTCSDFKYLSDYADQVVDVYLSPINCKSTANGAIYRFVPLAIEKVENYQYDSALAPKFAIDYVAMDQFDSVYLGDPNLEVMTSYSQELIGIKDVKLSYASDNTEVAYFEEKEGKTFFHVNSVSGKTANITVTATLGDATATGTTAISYLDASDAKTIKEGVDAEVDAEVKLRGVISGKILNKQGFYLTDDTGTIAVIVKNSADLKNINNGYEIVVTGIRTTNEKETQISIKDAEVLGIVSTGKVFSREKVIETSIDELTSNEINASMTANIYQLSAYVFKTDSKYPQIYFYADEAASKTEGAGSLRVYSGSSGQYAFLEPMIGKQVTVELTLCNWNGKAYLCCPLSLSDGTTIVYNQLHY